MPDAVSTPDLMEALALAFHEPVSALDRRPSLYSSSFAIEELDILFGGGRTVNAIFKNLGRDGMLDEARAVKPSWFYDPCREIGVYREILPGFGAPRLFGSTVDPFSHRYWLFVERVCGEELYQLGDFDCWLEAARWVGRLHAAPQCCQVSARALVPQLIEHDRAYYDHWVSRARIFAGPDVDPIVDKCSRAIDVLLALPRTFIHGEYYASNILVERQPRGARIRPVDWEMAAIGPGILDVAALASGSWTPKQRLSMLHAYCSVLPYKSHPADLLEAFESARLLIALQWLGWSRGWAPCSQHAFDWRAEALDASAALSEQRN